MCAALAEEVWLSIAMHPSMQSFSAISTFISFIENKETNRRGKVKQRINKAVRQKQSGIDYQTWTRW